MEPIDFLGALRRSWRLLIALGVVGALVGVLLPVSHPKTHKTSLTGYAWSASLVVGASPTGPSSVLGGGLTNGQVAFYSATAAVKTAALQAFGFDSPSPALANLLLSSRPAGPVSKRGVQTAPELLTAQAGTAYQAVILVTLYEQQLADYLVNLASNSNKQTKASSSANSDITETSIGFQMLEPAGAVSNEFTPKASITSTRKVRVFVGLGIGLLLAALIILARELLDKRIRSRDRAESTFGYPAVAEIPGEARFRGETERDLDVIGEPDSVAAEAYRMLRMSVLFESLAPKVAQANGLDALLATGMGMGLGNGAPVGNGNGKSAHSTNGTGDEESTGSSAEAPGGRQVVLVVSPGTEPTRPQVAANFAAVYAEAGQRAVVVSTAELGTGRNGVPTGSISGEINSEDVESRLEPSRIENVFRLPLSDFVDNSGQLVTRAPAVIEATRPLADVIVVEAPPLLAVHHAEALSHAVDVVLVVGECWKTTYDDARRAGELLRRMDAPVLGVVLTNVRISKRDIRHAQAALGRGSGPQSGQAPEPGQELVADLSAAGAGTQTQA